MNIFSGVLAELYKDYVMEVGGKMPGKEALAYKLLLLYVVRL